MPNELHTETGVCELPDDMTACEIDALLVAAGTGWTLSRAVGMWMAERHGPGNKRHYVVSETATALALKIIAAESCSEALELFYSRPR